MSAERLSGLYVITIDQGGDPDRSAVGAYTAGMSLVGCPGILERPDVRPVDVVSKLFDGPELARNIFLGSGVSPGWRDVPREVFDGDLNDIVGAAVQAPLRHWTHYFHTIKEVAYSLSRGELTDASDDPLDPNLKHPGTLVIIESVLGANRLTGMHTENGQMHWSKVSVNAAGIVAVGGWESCHTEIVHPMKPGVNHNHPCLNTN